MYRIRAFVSIAAALVAASSALTPVRADEFPSKPIKFLVPAAPAGIGDILPRLFAQKLGEAGSPATIVVENWPAGNGVLAYDAVAKAPPDGYLMLMGNHGGLAMNPHLAKSLPYDPLKSFAPIILLVTVPNILVVHPSVPAHSLKELIAYAKANPGKLSYASQGSGASGHIAAELLKLHAGIDIVHVPYRGAAPAAQDLAAGHVSMMFDVVSLALPQITAGRVRPIAVAAKQRVAMLPDVPTLIEQGMEAEVGAWFGMLGPAGMSPEAVGWVNREAAKVFSVPDTRDRFVQQGAAVPLGTPEAFGKFIEAESARYADIIRRAGIKLE
jgi:tripartite-type tricarboxylate transporter receptor subunit TctC